ncbi:Protein ltv1 [Dimargaris verticillata]|uniref:Protein ltv1 n=1 Tax=Dimargaris verticillata TaxID=2761393 RepID=A0A9W8B5S2_9FUNG|nr:Protein ltv1 [Dimargaris verticillata]
MVKKGFIDRSSARHFQLVHRSQHDPLVNDSESSQKVFVEVNPKHISRTKQASTPTASEQPSEDAKSRAGQAALHGIYFDDREYDYMQHLKPIGTSTDGVLLTASSVEPKQAGITFIKDADTAFDSNDPSLLPPEALPSTEYRQVTAADQEAYPRGLLLDYDPEVRATLEALEDEDCVDEALDDDFFDLLDSTEPVEYTRDEEAEPMDEEQAFIWRVKQASQQRATAGSDSVSCGSDEDRRTMGTNFSMSSSAMFRNDKLTLLDDQFEQYEARYGLHSDDGSDDDSYGSSEEDVDPEVVAQRRMEHADFENILDEFLGKYEVKGSKLHVKLEGDTPLDRVDTLRHALVDDDSEGSVAQGSLRERQQPSQRDEYEVIHYQTTRKYGDDWDCESILSTYSNTENHPQLISEEPRRRIKLNSRTGMPSLEKDTATQEPDHDASESTAKVNRGAPRSKNETAEEKKQRKQAMKQQKQVRRQEKKATKASYHQQHLNSHLTRNEFAHQIPLP